MSLVITDVLLRVLVVLERLLNNFDKFESVCDKYLPISGEGNTMATQIVTAVCKLVYKWYNDGDVFDNTYHLEGWANDLSSYANWLYKYTDGSEILEEISDCWNSVQYESLLAELADVLLSEKYLVQHENVEAKGSIYKCGGPFKYEEYTEDEEDDGSWWEDDSEYDYEEE